MAILLEKRRNPPVSLKVPLSLMGGCFSHSERLFHLERRHILSSHLEKDRSKLVPAITRHSREGGALLMLHPPVLLTTASFAVRSVFLSLVLLISAR